MSPPNLINPYMFVVAAGDNAWFTGGQNNSQVGQTEHEYSTDGGSTWTTGSTLPTAMGQGMAGGSYNSAIMGGGGSGSGGGQFTQSYSYDGTGWTSLSGFTGIRGNYGGGDSTDAITIAGRTGGGTYEANSSAFNGTSWGTFGAPTLSNGRYDAGTDASSTTNALLAAGRVNSPYNTITNESVSLSGGTWTVVGTYIQTTNGNTVAGDNTDALGWCGGTGTKDAVGSYTPTTWSTQGNSYLNNGYGIAGGGDSTNALGMGGYNTDTAGVSDLVDSWDGSTWTSLSTMSIAVQYPYGDFQYV